MQLDGETNLNDHAGDQLVKHFQVIFNRLRTLKDTLGESATGTEGSTVYGRLAEMQRNITDLQTYSESARSTGISNLASESEPAAAVAIPGETLSSKSISDPAAVAATTIEKMPVIEGVITVLNREMEKMTVDMEALERQRRMEREQLDNMDRKVRNMERMMAMKDATISELNLRLTSVEQTSYDGTLLWRVPGVQKKREEAVSGKVTSIYSSPFFTSRTGV